MSAQPPSDPPETESEDYQLEPVQAESAEARRRGLDDTRAPVEVAPVDPPDFERSFSLQQMFGVFVVAAVVLAVMRLFPPPIAAGVAGLAVLFGQVLLSLADPPAAVLLTWWVLLAIYFVAAGFAIVNG